MLEFLRKFYGSIFGKVITILVGFLFIVGFSFLPYIIGGGGGISPQNAATVNGKPISMNEFNRYYTSLQNMYRRIYGPSLTETKMKKLNLTGAALSSLIADKILEGREGIFGINLSERYLANEIANIPDFQKNGKFSNKLFTSILLQNHTTPAVFEKHYKNEIERAFLRNIIQTSFSFTNQQLKDDYKIRNKSVSFEIAIFKSKIYADKFIKKIILSNNNFAFLAKKYNVNVVNFPLLTNTQLVSLSSFKKYKPNNNLLKAIFSEGKGRTPGEPIPLNSGFAVLKIKEIKFPHYKISPQKKLTLARTYVMQKQAEFLDDYVNYLESKANIKINKKALKIN
jgi:hypothetical protein